MLKELLDRADKHQLHKIAEVIEEHMDDDVMVMFEIDEAIYGPHMCEHVARHAVECMEHDNGGKGEKYPADITREHLRRHKSDADKVQAMEWDFYYVMNMMYSDYVEVFGDDINTYSKLALKFIDDIDAPKDKVKRYYYMNK